ncbi:MAG: hypothetical protein ACREMA_09810 [Longimicrobiales bacterium]
MRNHMLRLLLSMAVGVPITAAGQQQPDTKRDTAFELKLAELRRDSTERKRPGSSFPRQTPGQVSGQSMNPDISAIGEMLADLGSGVPLSTEGERFQVREVELGIQSVVDPFFRADFFIGLHPDGVEIEEAFLTALTLPGGVQAKIGRFHVPIGKVNLIHRPEQITIDYPWMIREFWGPEGLASSGVTLSSIFAPLGFFQELLVYGVGNIGPAGEHDDEVEDFLAAPDAGRLRNQVAVGAQLRNFWDLSQATNLEIGFSAATGRVRELVPDCEIVDPCPDILPSEVFLDQSYYGPYLTLRWRPPERGLYRSLIWNNELLVSDGEQGTRVGGFSQAQWQMTRRFYLGARWDFVQRFEDVAGDDTEWFNALSGYLTFFPSEFSRLKLGLERTFGEEPFGDEFRPLLQMTFAIGPHRPHAF